MLDQAMTLTFVCFILSFQLFISDPLIPVICILTSRSQILTFAKLFQHVVKKPFSVCSLSNREHMWIFFFVHKLVKQIVIFSELFLLPCVALCVGVVLPRIVVEDILTGCLHLLNKCAVGKRFLQE